MWPVVLITLLNAWADNERLVLTYRVILGGVPINIFDGLLALGGVVVLARVIGRPRGDATWRMPTGVTVTLLVYLGVTVAAVAAGVLDENPAYAMFAAARNFLTIPIAGAIGFYAPRQLADFDRFMRVLVLAGVGVAALVLIFFGTRGTSLRPSDTIDVVRGVQYVSNYATLGLCVLVAAVLRGTPLVSTPLSLGLAGLCFVGQMATLSRSEWLACLAAMASTVVATPSRKRARAAVLLAATVSTMVVALYAGLVLASSISNRDWVELIEDRTMSVVPGPRSASDRKAWDTRVPGATRELELWAESPLWGRGFGIQEADELRLRSGAGFRHNTFTSIMAETGVLGLLAVLFTFGTMFRQGWRLTRHPDRGVALMGTLGITAVAFYSVLGMSTMSFNQMRFAIPLAMIYGLVARCAVMARAAVPLGARAPGSP